MYFNHITKKLKQFFATCKQGQFWFWRPYLKLNFFQFCGKNFRFPQQKAASKKLPILKDNSTKIRC